MLKKNFISGVEFFLSVNIPGMWIDFNVTPDKKTIFILNESEILEKIIRACENLIQKTLVIKTHDSENQNKSITSNSHSCVQRQSDTCCIDEIFLDIGAAHSVQLSKEDISKLIPIGQFNNGFIICSKMFGKATELYAIDQHAADERIRFEEIANNHPISCQRLVQPIKLNIATEDEEFVLKNFDTIRSSGFLIRQFEQNFFLDALPNFHGAETTVEGFYILFLHYLMFLDFNELIAFIKDHGMLYKNMCPKFQRVLASRACRSAVMIGSPLTTLQIRKVSYLISNI